MLVKYAPEVDDGILDRLVATFAELRHLADQGIYGDLSINIALFRPNTVSLFNPRGCSDCEALGTIP